MMRRFEMEPRPVVPSGFDDWLHELGMVADGEGEWALVGLLWHSPREHCAYLAGLPGVWPQLWARAQYADRSRFAFGVWTGRRRA
jgi:hypothetical protein